jgi:hypothetical protein
VLRRCLTVLLAAGCTVASLSAAVPAQGAGSSCGRRKVIEQANLNPPRGQGRAKGVEEILSSRSCGVQLAVLARHLVPNTKHDAYAVWLYNTRARCRLLGFVRPPVGRRGRLRAQGALPRHWRRFRHLVVSLEKYAHPGHPHEIVLIGPLGQGH